MSIFIVPTYTEETRRILFVQMTPKVVAGGLQVAGKHRNAVMVAGDLQPGVYPAEFEYFAPRTIDEAVQLLDRFGPEAKILAGGQSLLPMMSSGSRVRCHGHQPGRWIERPRP